MINPFNRYKVLPQNITAIIYLISRSVKQRCDGRNPYRQSSASLQIAKPPHSTTASENYIKLHEERVNTFNETHFKNVN